VAGYEEFARPLAARTTVLFDRIRHRSTNPDDTTQKQQLIHTFINSIHVYDDKMVIMFNYKDGDRAVTFDEIREMLAKRENPDNHNDYQGSPLKLAGEPSATRTRDTLIKSYGHWLL